MYFYSDKTTNQVRVVMSGPLPPAIGGMSSAISDISRSKLVNLINLVTFNTAKQTPEKRPVWQGVFARLKLMGAWWKLINVEKDRTVVHIHTCSGLTFYLDGVLLLLARMQGIPVILHIHGGRFDMFFDEMNGLQRSFARFLSKKANYVIVLSQEWLRILEQRLRGSRFHVIHNGVHIPAEFTDRHIFGEKKLTILYLGNLCQAKGVLDLLEAMRVIYRKARLVIVGGDKEQNFSKRIEEKLLQYGLNENVILTGPCYGEDKQAWLNKADIFVLPSYSEGLPISLLEAMASSLPVVATPVGAIPMVIRDGEDGFLVPPGDVDALGSVLQKLIDDHPLRKRMAMAAYQRCLSEFNLEDIASQYADIYMELDSER